MAIFDPNNPNFNQTPTFDYNANKENLDLRKKLASGLYNAPVTSGQMVNGWYAPVSAGSQFAQALGKVAGGLAIGKLNQDASGLASQDANAVDAATGYNNPANTPMPQQLGNSYSMTQPDGANWMSTGTQPAQYNAPTPNAQGVFSGAAGQDPNAGNWLSTGNMNGTSPTDWAKAMQQYAQGNGGSGNSSGQQDSNASPVDSSVTGSVPNAPQLNLPKQLSKEDQAKQDDAQFWHDVTRLAYSGPAGRMLADNMVARKNAVEQAQLNYVYKAPNYEPIKNSDGDVTGFFDKTTGRVFGTNGQPAGTGTLGGTQPTLRDLQKQREQQQLEGKTPEQQLAHQKAEQERATKVGEYNANIAGLDNSMRDTNRLLSLIKKYGTGGLNNIANNFAGLPGLVGLHPETRAELQEMQTLLNQGTFHTAIGLLNGAGRLGQAEFKAINDHSMTPSTDLSTQANLNILERQLKFLKDKKAAEQQALQGYQSGNNVGVGGLDAAAPAATQAPAATSNGSPAGYKQRYTAPAGGVPNI